jgi:hypothetical protein
MENIFLSEKRTHNSRSHVYEHIFRKGGARGNTNKPAGSGLWGRGSCGVENLR